MVHLFPLQGQRWFGLWFDILYMKVDLELKESKVGIEQPLSSMFKGFFQIDPLFG